VVEAFATNADPELVGDDVVGSVVAGHDLAMGNGAGTRPSKRDYGCGIIAALGALLFLSSVLGGMIALVTHGVSFGLVVSVGFNLLFWYWIATGAWRRTTWSTQLPGRPATTTNPDLP
jgi:hypothetical protein